MAFCTHCGADITAGSRFCGSCGSAVSDASDAPTQRIRRPSDDSIALGEQRLLVTLRQVTLGEYEVLTEIGRGGMAVVFLAHDIALDRKVAIKVMSPALTLMDAGVQVRFKREARTAASLSHPHIIPVYAVREGRDIVYFVMKYVAGRSLESVIRELGPLPIPMIRTIVTQVGAALGYAHRKGVVHRDVKPANIMLDDEGWVVVTDFGIAKVSEAQALTMTGGVVGTPSYMSPEQCAGREITGAADQYSLGVVVYEMLTGRQPFHSGTMVNLLYDHCHTPPPSILEHRADCPPELADAVMKMLEKDPTQRFPSVEDAVVAIGAVSDSQSGAVRTQMVTLAQAGPAAQLLHHFRTPGSPLPSEPAGAGTDASDRRAPRAATDRRVRRVRRWRVAAVAVLAIGLPSAVAAWMLLGRPSVATGAPDGVASPPAAVRERPVDPPDPVPTGLAVEPDRLSLVVGESASVSATAIAQDGSGIPDAAIRWASAEPRVATVDAGGAVITTGTGTTVLTARIDTITAEVPITVVAAPRPSPSPAAPAAVSAVRLAPDSARLTPGQTTRLRAAALDARGRALTGRAVTWTTGDATVASVDAQGLVTAHRIGVTTVRASSEGRVAAATITVGPEPVAAVSVLPEERTLEVGDTAQLTVRVVGASGSTLERPVSWVSSDPDVVAVSGTGRLRALGPGTATVTATLEGSAGRATITVRAAPPQSPPEPTAAETEARIDARLEAYRRAIESADLAAVRDAFPAIPADQETQWRRFFQTAEGLRVTFTIVDRAIGASSATVRVRARYQYRADGSQDQTSEFTATFERSGREWHLIGIR